MKIYLSILLFVSASLFAQPDTSYSIYFNDIIFPISNNGILADVAINENLRGMLYKNKSVLFSGGFYLSGYNDGKLWANGVASASRNEDYLPGSYKHRDLYKLAKVYSVRSDEPFGEGWHNWKDAVKLGADFHDGDKDGIYNPIDHNRNSQWDYNEDRPDLIGNETVWCVFHDNVPGPRRRMIGESLGIDIQQTVFTTMLKNIIFVRYRIENTGLVTDLLDSVYFGAWADPDIGDYNDDLLGCDTTLNAGFAYNDGPDNGFGQSSPSLLVSILQGPAAFIPSKTYNDINGNGIFDESDITLSTAFEVNGFIKGTKEINGATNLNATSFSQNIISHTFPDPDDVQQIRSNMLGLFKTGQKINPCDWAFGEVFNEDCNNINSLFQYSGNPIIPQGWINTSANDQRMMLNTGPFKLEKSKPIDIVVAYVVGFNETSPLSSIDNAKKRLRDGIPYFTNNGLEIIDIGDTTAAKPAPNYLFGIKQNYPNPFNATTQITYAIPYSTKASNVSLKVYNLLGQLVATLVDEVQKDGIYTVQFSGEDLSSGIYIMILNNVGYSQSHKLLLLK